jgi:soluble lytic murein transglycosylase
VRSRIAALLFFAGPAALVAFALSLRTAGVVDSHAAVEARVLRFRGEAASAAASEGVDLPLLLAVACVESSGRPDAVSRAGAVGLLQLLPTTALEMSLEDGVDDPDLTDPATSLRLGARYLRRRLDEFADHAAAKELALCAYNAGPGAVASWIRESPPDPGSSALGGWIPAAFGETRAFVRRVTDWEARWRDRLAEEP